MTKILFIILLIIPTTFCFSQNIEQQDNQLQSLPETESKFIIGIGNEKINFFNDVLANLQSISNLKVYAVCETHRVIGVTVQNSTYKSYDVLRDYLLDKFPDILLFQKNDSIFNLDCKDEILKQ